MLEPSLALTVELLTLEQMYESLCLAAWDAGVFATLVPSIRTGLASADLPERQRWVAALDAVWTGRASVGEPRDLAFTLGTVAGAMQHWRYATAFFEASLDEAGAPAASRFNLGVAHWHRAHHDDAQRHLEASASLDPGRAEYGERLRALTEWRARCRALIGDDAFPSVAADPDAAIRLTTLGPQHARSLVRQHRDPQLATFVRVPHLSSADEAARWIDAQLDVVDRTSLAVVHEEFGIVGVVAVDRRGDAALVSYWIDADFRRRGFGRRALDLLVAFVADRQIVAMYAPIYEPNHPSRRLLESLGFCVLPCFVVSEAERMVVFHRSLAPERQAGDAPVEQLRRVLGASEWTLQAAASETTDPRSAPHVELVFDPDCPNVDHARAAIREALTAIGAPVAWQEWDRGAPATPPTLRMLGSPSVLVNGRDVGGEDARMTDGAARSCRLYGTDAKGMRGAPSAEDILEYLRM